MGIMNTIAMQAIPFVDVIIAQNLSMTIGDKSM